VPVRWKIPFSIKDGWKQLSADRQTGFTRTRSELLKNTESKFPEWLSSRLAGRFPPSRKVGEMSVKSPCSLVNVYVTAAGAGAANRRLAKES
jgi:hypothetical protein